MENQIIEKKDDYTLTVTKTEPVAVDFDISYLKKQRETIVAQKAKEMAQRDAEIAEIDSYLAEATKLGVTEKQAVLEQTPTPAPAKGGGEAI